MSACHRAWQAEAVFDGGLSKADRASFERHAQRCETCRAELASLERLRALTQRLPGATSRPLGRRALRHALLRRANELALTTPSRTPWLTRRSFAWAVGLVVVVLGVAMSWSAWRAPAVVADPSFELAVAPGTRWHVQERGRATRLVCEAGTLTVSVHELEPGQRFLIVLPDGELEVRGTRFVIEVSEHRTRRLTVSEGRVALRLFNRPEVLVAHGEVWTPPEELPVAVAPPPSATSSDGPERPQDELELPGHEERSKAARQVATPRGVAPLAAREPVAASSAAPTASPDASSTPSAEALDYAEAMSAFSRGDCGAAGHLFTRFERRHPKSAHREDVLFLRALCRAKSGDPAGARALAEEYLRRYPRGFRVPEATRLAGSSAPSNPGGGHAPE